MERKLALLAGLMTKATPKEAKYLVRIVTGNLRLGIADMTVLDALASAFGGGKEAREALERAYNISSDLGRVAKTLVERGLEGVSEFEVLVGNPIRPMLAERLSSPQEILEKLGGKQRSRARTTERNVADAHTTKTACAACIASRA